MIVDSSELSSLGGGGRSALWWGWRAVEVVAAGEDSDVDCMKRKLRMLYHLSHVVSSVKSAKLT